MSRIAIFITFMFVGSLLIAQDYPYLTKKEQKFYDKIDSYYEVKPEKTIKNEDAILEFAENHRDTIGADLLFILGEAYQYGRGDLPKAVKYYTMEYEIQKEVGAQGEGFANSAFNLAYTLTEMGQYDQSEEIYLELMRVEEANGLSKEENILYNGLSLLDLYNSTVQADKGLALIKDFKKDAKNGTLLDAMLNYYAGEFYVTKGRYSKGEKALQKDLEILEEIGMYPSIEYTIGLAALARLYLENGKLPLSEEIYAEARDMISRLEGEWTDYELSLKSSQGLLYTQLGNYQKAESLYRDIMILDKDFFGEESYAYAADALNLGINYVYAKEFAKAEQQLLVAAEKFKQLLSEESLDYVKTIRSLTSLYTQWGKLDKAQELGKKAIGLTEKVSQDKYQHAFDYYNMGEVYAKLGDLDKALEYHEKSADLWKKSVGTTHSKYARSTNKLAINNWKAENIKDAQEYYKETFDNYFTQINTVFPVLSEEEKAKFYYNNLRPAFEQYNSFIVETSREDKELIGEMFDYQLATKGLILSATNKVKNAILNSGDSAVIAKYDLWISQKEELAQLFSASDIPVEIRNKKIDSLNESSNQLEKELSKQSSEFAETFASNDLTWKDIQSKLKPGEAAVEIVRFRDFDPDSSGVFTDEVYYAGLIVTSETVDYPEMVLMRNGKKMETRFLSNYRNAIKYKVNENYSYKLFWQPIARKLEGIKKVYFTPDGVFNQISIYTLRNPDTGNFTLDELDIQVLTNTKDLLTLADNGPSTGESYLFGYPNYNMGVIDQKTEEEGGTAAENIVNAAKEDRSVGRGMSRGGTRGVRGTRGNEKNDLAELTRSGALPSGIRGNMLRYMRSNQLLGLLPGTKREVNLIDSLYAQQNASGVKFPVVKYLDNVALEDSIKKLHGPKTLHIATHGFFLESDHDEDMGEADTYVQNPLLRSGLMLAGANSYISSGVISDRTQHKEDGILTAYEAMNLDLNETDLVVMSACETGLGEVKNGEGVYGLQRAFQVAGAEALIMSMWSVDDDATQELMTIFYEEWLSGKSKQEAFNTAQKRLKDKWKYPYYWGAFVLVGK